MVLENRCINFSINGKPNIQQDKSIEYSRMVRQFRSMLFMDKYEVLKECLFCGLISIHVDFFMPLSTIPRIRDSRGLFHTGKPCINDLVGFIVDVMRTVVYSDDSYIYTISATKYYSKHPRTQITIKEIIQDDPKELNISNTIPKC